jgi:protease IV
MNPLVRFIRGLWHGLDVFRRVLHLLLLLVLLLVVLAVLRPAIPRLAARNALVIRPSGELTEQIEGEPLLRMLSQARGEKQPQTLVWDLTDAIRAAATDSRIQALLIETDDLDGAGQAKLEELASALQVFHRSGKKIIARGTLMLKSQYYLAAQADEVYLDPFGAVLLDGYERYRLFFKDALDKLGVDMHLFRAGKFKSAEEPFVRRDMSVEDREESTVYLQALWNGYQSSVAGARGLKPQQISQYTEQYLAAVKNAGGDTAAVALNAGLVTAIKTPQQVEARMIELLGRDADAQSFPAVSVDDYLRVVNAEKRVHFDRRPTIGVITASGEIIDGIQSPGTIGGESMARSLREARLDPQIKAVVLRIDSPGGSVFASEQIYREVLALKAAGKPVVASMGDVAASGGYYIAAPADEIIASPNTITGSIGVFASVPTFNRTLEKLGISSDGVGTTALSGAMRLERPMSAPISDLVQTAINHTYDQFVARVSSGRGQTSAQIDAIGQGRVWVGVDALRLGLVDHLGTYEDALAAAAKRAHLPAEYRVRRLEPQLNLAQQLAYQLQSSSLRAERMFGITSVLPAPLMKNLDPLDRELARWQHLSMPDQTYAYCFCTVE